MDQKMVILAILLILAVLFLSTVGSFWTGYAVLKQNDITLKDYPYPFVKNSDYNSLYIAIPDQSTLNEQQASEKIAKYLQSTLPVGPKIVTVSNLPEGKHNLILLGDACTNPLIALLFNTDSCTLNLKEGQGLLKLFNYEQTSTLVVSGYDVNAIQKAANVLSNHNAYPLKGTEAIVNGNLNDMYSYSFIFN